MPSINAMADELRDVLARVDQAVPPALNSQAALAVPGQQFVLLMEELRKARELVAGISLNLDAGQSRRFDDYHDWPGGNPPSSWNEVPLNLDSYSLPKDTLRWDPWVDTLPSSGPLMVLSRNMPQMLTLIGAGRSWHGAWSELFPPVPPAVPAPNSEFVPMFSPPFPESVDFAVTSRRFFFRSTKEITELLGMVTCQKTTWTWEWRTDTMPARWVSRSDPEVTMLTQRRLTIVSS